MHFSGDGKIKVIDGPFAETKELIAGFCVIQAKSLQEAIEWAKRAPNLHTGQESHIEVRQFFELAQIAKVGYTAGTRNGKNCAGGCRIPPVIN